MDTNSSAGAIGHDDNGDWEKLHRFYQDPLLGTSGNGDIVTDEIVLEVSNVSTMVKVALCYTTLFTLPLLYLVRMQDSNADTDALKGSTQTISGIVSPCCRRS